VSKYSLLAKFANYSCAALFALFVVGCGGGYQAPPQPISITVTPLASAMGVSQSIPFTAAGDPKGVTWSVLGAPFLGSPSVIMSPGSIDSNGNYTGPGGASSFYVTVTATSKTDPTKSASATINLVAPGQFTTTNNVQVAQYAVIPPSSANVSVQFGLDTSYGLTTWTQPNSTLGSAVSLYVAGMKASTPYHMRGVIAFADGSAFNDADQTFTTGAVPANLLPALTVTTTAGMTPQSGVELLALLQTSAVTSQVPAAVTDLAGNLLWAYSPAGLPAGDVLNPIKLLPNGHFLINFSGPAPDGVNSILQEVDLAGNLIWQMTAAQLNTALAAATCAGCNIKVVGTHHDFVMLPNGHLIVIASTEQVVSGMTVAGDVLIDLGDIDNVGGNNPNHTPLPVWLWNEFDHLDINRRPYMYPDWTHTNAILYSATDGNLIISIRHQNWVIKIDYNNGAGAGDILWHLGYQGDFALLNADGSADTTGTDWFFAQHGPSFTTANTSGKFSMILFDNGDDRGVVDVANGTCNKAGQPACFSTVPIFDIDETAKTATFAFHPTTPDYSFFGGNADVLNNGNAEYDECSNGSIEGNNAAIFEVTQTSTPQTVWHMKITGQYAYRGFRMGSLYPGVQW
jgi:arylsulfate sulfotransferase